MAARATAIANARGHQRSRRRRRIRARPLPPSSARYAYDRTILGRAGQDALGDRPGQVRKKRAMSPADPSGPPRTETDAPAQEARNPNRFRLERFGKAMSGTDGWEVPGAVLSGEHCFNFVVCMCWGAVGAD